MNIRLVLVLSLLGLVVGILSILGILRSGLESIVWLVIALFYGAAIAARAPGKFFLHGFLTGLISGALASLVQAAFIGQYLAHNPKAAESFKILPANLPPAILVDADAPGDPTDMRVGRMDTAVNDRHSDVHLQTIIKEGDAFDNGGTRPGRAPSQTALRLGSDNVITRSARRATSVRCVMTMAVLPRMTSS